MSDGRSSRINAEMNSRDCQEERFKLKSIYYYCKWGEGLGKRKTEAIGRFQNDFVKPNWTAREIGGDLNWPSSLSLS